MVLAVVRQDGQDWAAQLKHVMRPISGAPTAQARASAMGMVYVMEQGQKVVQVNVAVLESTQVYNVMRVNVDTQEQTAARSVPLDPTAQCAREMAIATTMVSRHPMHRVVAVLATKVLLVITAQQGFLQVTVRQS